MDAPIPEPFNIFNAFRVIDSGGDSIDAFNVIATGVRSAHTTSLGSRRTNLDIDFEMQSQLNMRGASPPALLHENIVELSEKVSDVREFTNMFASIKTSLDRESQSLQRAETEEAKIQSKVDEIIAKIKVLGMDTDDQLAILNVLDAHRSECCKKLNVQELRRRKDELSKKFAMCTPILKHIRDELTKENVLPESDDQDQFGTCPICFQNKVQCCLIPCGHCFCTSCALRATTSCFVCNQSFSDVNRLFL